MAGVSACLMAFLIGFQGAIQVLGGQVAAIADNAPDHPVQEYVNLLPHWEPDVLETCLVFQGKSLTPGIGLSWGKWRISGPIVMVSTSRTAMMERVPRDILQPRLRSPRWL